MIQNIHQHLNVAFMTLKVLLDEERCVEKHVYLSIPIQFSPLRNFARSPPAELRYGNI